MKHESRSPAALGNAHPSGDYPQSDLSEQIRQASALRTRQGPLTGAAPSVVIIVDAERIAVGLDALTEAEENSLLNELWQQPDVHRLLRAALDLVEAQP
jgi:hypothetical protein